MAWLLLRNYDDFAAAANVVKVLRSENLCLSLHRNKLIFLL